MWYHPEVIRSRLQFCIIMKWIESLLNNYFLICLLLGLNECLYKSLHISCYYRNDNGLERSYKYKSVICLTEKKSQTKLPFICIKVIRLFLSECIIPLLFYALFILSNCFAQGHDESSTYTGITGHEVP